MAMTLSSRIISNKMLFTNQSVPASQMDPANECWELGDLPSNESQTTRNTHQYPHNTTHMQTIRIHSPHRLPVILITPIPIRPSVPEDIARVNEDQDREDDVDYNAEKDRQLDEDHDNGVDQGDECLGVG